jgi:ferric-dicitrate binding protein FerR (iron transport regulator)
MKKSEDIWTRMARYLAGEMNMKEEIAFRDSLNGDPRQQRILEQMEGTWKKFEDNDQGGPGDPGRAWDKLYTRLESDGLLEGRSASSGERNLLPALRVAASILLILAIGIPALYFGVIRNGTENDTTNHYCEKGVSTVDLPDGSRIYLNEGSGISYPSQFNLERSVTLEGEAFFEVMSDPVNPFSVNAGKVVVSVLGTSFNIKEVTGTRDVEVYVESGKVRMGHENSGQFITLNPGEVGMSEDSDLTSSEMSDPNYISWKTKDFKFVDEELMEVLLELEESYHVKIHTQEMDLSGMKITTTYREQSIDAILETIGTAFGMTVRSGKDGYYLTN